MTAREGASSGAPSRSTTKGLSVPCSSSCPTQDHQSYGACLRSKHLEIGNPEAHKFMQKQSSEIDAYVNARKAGLQPESFKAKDVLYAEKRTEQLGRPFRADKGDM